MSQVAAISPASAAAAIIPAVQGIDQIALARSYALCHEVTRSRARNFYYGLRLTPEPRRSAVYSMYAWMRAGDDVCDAEGELNQRRAAFAQFRRDTRLCLAGDFDHHPQPSFWPAFAATVSSYRIGRDIIDEMLAGLEEDLDHRGYQTRAELDRYCYRVGSTVGLSCISIWGLADGANTATVRAKAECRGIAFQMTNILRDVAQDFDAADSRVYLPIELFERHGLTPAQLRQWNPAERCAALMREEVDRTLALYRESEGLESMIDPACAGALWGMTRIYRGLLERIAADPARVFTGRRVRLSSIHKVGIAITAAVKARTGRW